MHSSKLVGTIHRLGHDNRVAARLPAVHEPPVRHLDMVESSIPRGLYYSPACAGGHRPTASRFGRTGTYQIRRDRHPRLRSP
jgi:hypothetical protein